MVLGTAYEILGLVAVADQVRTTSKEVIGEIASTWY